MKEAWNEIKWFFTAIPRTEKAIILTLLSMFAILFTMTLIHLKNNPTEIMLEMIAEREDFVDIEKLLEEEKQLQENPITENTKVTTREFNEADAQLKHDEGDFKTLDELLEERSMSEANENLMTANSPSAINLPVQPKLTVSEDVVKKTDKQKVNKNSLVRYSLTERSPLGDLPNPVFTCEASGTVVVNIKVDASGRVIDASFNVSSSSTTNGCLVDNALQYARQARFDSSARKEQLGTITYLYQGK